VAKANGPAGDLLTVSRGLCVLWIVLALDIVCTLLLPRPPELAGSSPWAGGWLSVHCGLRPRDPWGLIGIPCAPFLHAGMAHLAANSLALFVTGYLALKSGRKAAPPAAVLAALTGGLLTWIIGDPTSIHVGASGVIFGFVALLLGNAIFRRGCLPLLIAVPVVLLYGAALTSMLPWRAPEHISWEMHLGGFLGGLAASFALRDRPAN
jgi:membrane associated rhomboid family serine protease